MPSLTNFGERYDDDDPSHYQHGIPRIPIDGKFVLLKNSKLKSNVYLVGTSHFSKKSVETVKKVINYVRPNAVAIELCEKRRADYLMDSEMEDVNLFKLLCNCMLAPWKLPMKIGIFALACWEFQLSAAGIVSGLEFKVAMEEASRMRARCFPIDEDTDVPDGKMSKVFSWVLLWKLLFANVYKDREYTRASTQEHITNTKKHYPELFKVLVDDKDKFMFEKIRTIRKNVVAVVGMGHMDGIELLWKHAEEDILQKKKNVEEGDNKQPLSSKKKKNNKQSHRKKKAVATVISNLEQAEAKALPEAAI